MRPSVPRLTSPKSRNEDLDFLKGCLVIVMVAYHAASTSRDLSLDKAVTLALPFIHSAFLVVVGFLGGYHYWHQARQQLATVRARLLFRAGKLMLLFAACNAALAIAGLGIDRNDIMAILTDRRMFATHFLWGISECFAFEILVYIAEFLCLAALVVGYPAMVGALLGAIVLLAVIVGGNTLLFLALGALGMGIGMAASEGRLGAWDRWLRQAWAPILAVLAVDVLTRSGHEFPSSNLIKLPVRSLETVLWFYAFIGLRDRFGSCTAWLTLLGRYTLFAYLLQMLLLRGTVAVVDLPQRWGFLGYFSDVTAATLVTYGAVVVLDQLRRRRDVDALYKFAFA